MTHLLVLPDTLGTRYSFVGYNKNAHERKLLLREEILSLSAFCISELFKNDLDGTCG